MQKPEIPSNDAERVQALIEINLLDTPMEESFERLTRITKALFNVPIVAFTLVDAERQWFKSSHGLSDCETSRDISFCAHTINQDDILVVNDASIDPRFANNPSVINEPFIRFYAGQPIVSPSGYKIGTICIADNQSRVFSNEKIHLLHDIGGLIEDEIILKKSHDTQKKLSHALDQAKRAQYIDNLTRVWNRGGIEQFLLQQAKSATIHNESFGVAIMDIDNFKSINDTFGHCAGDAVLREVSRRMLSAYRESDILGRWGGEEFLAIINSDDKTELLNIAERVRKSVCHSAIPYEAHEIPVSITIGLDEWHPKKSMAVDMMVSNADAALYKGKNSGKNKVVCAF